MNKEIFYKEFTELLGKHVDGSDALEFLQYYHQYTHAIDDLVDEKFSPELLGKVNSLACICYSSNFWRKYCDKLFLIDALINNQYYDSVLWEQKENEKWLRVDAKALSHCAYNMRFVIIYLLFGREELRKFSASWREHAHLSHINDII